MSTNVLDQAQNVQGIVSAARFRDRMARREANATDDADRRAAREAIFDVEERFPELKEIPVGGAEAFARERGHGRGSRSPVHGGRRRSGGSKARAKVPIVKEGAKGRGLDRRPIPGIDPDARRARSPRSRPASTPRVDRAIRRTGIPAAASSTGSLLMSAVGVTVGLGFAYLVLTSAESPGSGATRLTHLLENVGPHAIGRFLDPYADVFPSNTGAGEKNPDFAGTETGGIPVYETRGFEKPRPGESLKQWGRRHQAEQRRRRQAQLRRKGQGGVHR